MRATLTALFVATGTILACASAPTAPTDGTPPTGQAPAEAGFTALFNGRDLTGWTGAVDGYEVKDGAIVCKAGQGGTLYTRGSYRNFVVRLEFKLPPAGNNGLAIRYPGDRRPGLRRHDRAAGARRRPIRSTPTSIPGRPTVPAYGMVASTRGHLKPVGEWNAQEVTVTGSSIKVVLNGVTILDADLATVTSFMADTPHPGKDRTEGHFGFAGHNDPVAFRNIRIRELP